MRFKPFNSSIIISGLVLLASLGMASCDSAKEDALEQSTLHTCKLVLNAEKQDYETTRAESTPWKEGDKIYLRFAGGTSVTQGMAEYKSGQWSVNFYGVLNEGTDLACSARFFDKPRSVSESNIVIGDSTIVYEDTNSVYTYNGSVLSVTASLSPKTGRVRFKGKEGDKVEVGGITRNTDYSLIANVYSTTSAANILTVGSDGYTPYIYGVFKDSDAPYLAVETSDAFFMREFSKSVYAPGESGFITIPTVESRNGWLYNEKKEVKVKGVTIPLMKVEKSDGSSFYLMQTELTGRQYNAIDSLASVSKTNLPVSQPYGKYTTLISTLNKLTGMKFRFPTRDEWTYASKGGKSSRGYTYSGSNTLSKVAWYSGNSSSTFQEVKLLRPNELGFYDMNGNIAEYVLADKSSSYYYYYYMGGSRTETPSSYGYGDYYSPYYSYNWSSIESGSSYAQGIRLALDSQ